MLALILISCLCGELAIYVAAGTALGLGVAGIAVLAIAAALLWRLALVALGFAIARACRSTLVPGLEIGVPAALRMVLAEWAAQAAAYAVLMPLERWLVPRCPKRAAAGPVVLMVHGIYCNGGAWWSAARFLRRHGVQNLYTINLEPVLGGIDEFAQQLARRIGEVLETSGASELTLVTHSMGGLVARAYLRQAGHRPVAKLITLGTPHHGSVQARLGVGLAARQMRPGSDWLARLERDRKSAADTAIVSIRSWHDNLVAPPESSVLPGAKDVALSGVGHVALLFSARVHELIIGEMPGRAR